MTGVIIVFVGSGGRERGVGGNSGMVVRVDAGVTAEPIWGREFVTIVVANRLLVQ